MMKKTKPVLVVVGFLAGAAGAEATWVDSYIYLQKQGEVCRVVKVDKSVRVSLFEQGVAWRIENQGCDEPAYVEIGGDISIGDHLLPPWCQRTYKVPDDVNLPPTCFIPPGSSYDGTYGFQVRVNCQPGQFCPPGDPEIVVERIGRGFFLLDPLVKPGSQRLPVRVTLRPVAGRCEAQLASSVTAGKEVKAIEWMFYNECGNGPHYVDLRGVPAAKDKLMLPKTCNQSGAIRESPMGARCHFENTAEAAGTYEYSVAVDCVGKASCAPAKATISVQR